MIRRRQEAPHNPTSKKTKLCKPFVFADLPPEVILQVLEYLPVKECERLITDAPKWLQPILARSVYGRSLLYLNYQDEPVITQNLMCQMLFKYLQKKDLENVALQNVYPDRFVFAYKFERSKYEYDKYDPFIDEFLEFFSGPAVDFFRKCARFEISIDLCNRTTDFNAVSTISKILASCTLARNLSYLNLNRFQRLPQDSLRSLERSLDLSKFTALHTVTLSSNGLRSFDQIKLPDSVLYLNLSNNKLTSLPAGKVFLPTGLVKLNLSSNNLRSLHGIVFPDSLQFLDIQLNCITKLGNVHFPSSLKVLIACCNNLSFSDEESIHFPKQLCYLNLLQNPYLNNINALNFHENLKNIYLDAAFANYLPNSMVTYV